MCSLKLFGKAPKTLDIQPVGSVCMFGKLCSDIDIELCLIIIKLEFSV